MLYEKLGICKITTITFVNRVINLDCICVAACMHNSLRANQSQSKAGMFHFSPSIFSFHLHPSSVIRKLAACAPLFCDLLFMYYWILTTYTDCRSCSETWQDLVFFHACIYLYFYNCFQVPFTHAASDYRAIILWCKNALIIRWIFNICCN